MDHRHEDKSFFHERRPDDPARTPGKTSGRISTAEKVFRAATAILVFGVPLVAGTAALLGYGVSKAYRRITRKS
ncbi:MAG: hypothetical protein A4E62_00817 [Syntrophorhabdus sp. PtaU1.Bin002]|nr:MAG: hypothetical protein A4E58_03047 [Syntrophorhabdus sp. PtaB.Bin006]OPY72495.1 MAG: hypothetical protein A4E62_00817 [Syntrophorhabdus sp. PtaU1.Bin002]